MELLIRDELLSHELIEKRKALGGDRYDEVWEGIYVINPSADNEHQDLVRAFTTAIATVWDRKNFGRTQAGTNVSDHETDWQFNYRVPDVLCFANDSKAVDRGSHWLGGPEFAVEITSPGDCTIEKLDFYARVGTKELLIIDRSPWKMTLYKADAHGRLMSAAQVCDLNHADPIESEIVPTCFHLDFQTNMLRISLKQGELIRELPFGVKADA